MAERLGAAYSPKARRPASSHAEHTQTTQASKWMSAEEAASRYPRLTAAMQRQGIVSRGEAGGAIASLKAGKPAYGEAVTHYGGAPRLARDAFRNRNLGR
jgi:hypothetical protein